MLRLVFTMAFGLHFFLGLGQLKKFYTIRNVESVDTLDFSLEAAASNCYIKSSDLPEPLTIFGNPDLEHINPTFDSKTKDHTCNVDLVLEQYRSSSISDGIFMAMSRDHTQVDNYWKILLDHKHIYKLNLTYGFGNADVDLSEMSVKNFKVKSGSAEIVVDYNRGVPNSIQMDTFLIKSDMGSIIAKHLNLARAKYVLANIGFGRALLDLSGLPTGICTVDASVGAGNLDIFLPGNEVPMIIYMKDSPLCAKRLAKGFEEVEKDVFVNMSYKPNAANLLTFKVDVALGNVSFHSPKE